MQLPSFIVSRSPSAHGGAASVAPAGQAVARPSVRPAGQAAGTSGALIDPVTGQPVTNFDGSTPSGTGILDSGASGFNETTGSGTAGITGALGQTTTTTTVPQTAAGQQALYNTVSGALNTTGSTIASIVSSGNALQIQGLASQTQMQIAQLQSQAQQAQAAGNLQLAQQNSAQAAQLQQFYQLLALKQQPTTTLLYAGAAVLGLGLLGAIAYFATRPPPTTTPATAYRTARRNPSDGSYAGNLRGHLDHHLRHAENPLAPMHAATRHVGALRGPGGRRAERSSTRSHRA